MFKYLKSFITAFIFAMVAVFPVENNLLHAQGISELSSKMLGEDIDASADNLSFVGNNIIAEGHVAVRYKDIWVSSDKAIINMSTKDVEATGRVRFIQRKRRNAELPYNEYLKLLDNPEVKVTRNGYVMTPTGRQLVDVTVVEEINSWTGERAVGNLSTGIFDLGKFAGKYDAYYISGAHAERTPKGTIRAKDVKLTTCEYVQDKHEHYSITASSVTIWPDKETSDVKYLRDSGHYSILAYNAVLRVFDIPIFYFPVMYRPPDDGLGWGIHARTGSDSDWGYFVQLKKTFKIYDYPNTKLTLLMDYFSKRGPAGGVSLTSNTRDSRTEAFIYGIHDTGVDERKGRFKFKEDRYDLWISHLNHITPRLDFRGHLEKLSDVNFLHDFFRDREDIDPQPTSFASLEYQFDRLSLGAYVRPRLNDFYSVVEKLPELRIDVPRQELFKNLYYQGEMSLAYMRMKWRKYDYARDSGMDIENYKAMRFDSLNMFYYPFKIKDFNFIPRAGVRFTTYSKTSKTKINQKQLETYGIVDSPFVDNPGSIVNYDSKGGGKLRVAAEFGLEVNTKIHQSWQDAKSAFWELDGLRHVMVPYINYNFIPSTTLSRDKIYYFDDVDRIEEQNFVRIGIKNRLQTRRGAYGAQQIYDWASIEHYMDFHFQEQNGDYAGDFGTIVQFQPFDTLSVSADLLIDLGKGSISKFAPTLEYTINEDWRLVGGYYYQNKYTERAAYSMGSALTDINSGSAFERHYDKNHIINGGIEFPILDDKTHGEGQIDYNLEASMLDSAKFGIVRSLHCWDVGFDYRIRQRNDDMGSMTWEHSFMFTLSLAAIPSFKISAKQGVGGANN